MKLAIAALLILMNLSVQSVAQTSVSLAWDASPAAELVTEYRIYQKTGTQWQKVGSVKSDKTTYTVPNLGPGAYAFYVTAFNVRESVPSNEVQVPAAPGAPKNARVVVEVRVE